MSFSSKFSSSTVNTSDVIEEAIRNRDIAAAKSLVTKRNRRQFSYKAWAILIETGVKQLEENLQNEFRSILVELAGEKILTFLRTALQNLDEEPVAVLILERRPELFLQRLDGVDVPFHLAASNAEAQVVEMFLRFVRKKNLWDLVDPGNPKFKGSPTFGNQETQHSTIVEKAAERGHLEVIKMLVNFEPKLLNYGYPLHKAVRGGHVSVVEFLLHVRGDLVEKFTPDPYPRSALFEDRTLGKDDPSSLEIDKLLVARIIRGGGPGKSPRMIKKLLQGPQDQHTEICLDLSIFSQRTHKFRPFVDGLVQEQQLFDVRFHPTLLYVQFPYLNASYQSNEPTAIGPEAEKILQWLKTKKSVTEIIELRVPGSTPRAESEEVIAKALSGITVDILDWRVLDLSIDILLRSQAKDVEELYLYSSGNFGVLQQWSGTEGVTLLPKLKHLEITIIKGMISEELEILYLERLRERLVDVKLANLNGRASPAPQVLFHANAAAWKSSESSVGTRQRLGKLQEYGSRPNVLDLTNSMARTNVTITKLKNFLNFYVGCDREHCEPTKVAIIDNGIDGTLSSLSRRITDGISFVEDWEGRESPWWLASDPHGTQMASFIHQLDPFCQLYIAKVCDESTGIDPDLVAQAIEWAISQKVDIISMSIALPSGIPKLEKAVEAAKRDNIVMVGSRGDRGNNRESVYPADYDEVVSISSLTSFGKRTESTETNAQYFFQGENVSIPAESTYLESQKQVSGSSVATALAAGVAALTLSCRRLGNEEKEMDRVKTVKAVFDRMTMPEKDKYVRPWMVFRDQRLGKPEGLLWLRAQFGENGDFYC